MWRTSVRSLCRGTRFNLFSLVVLISVISSNRINFGVTFTHAQNTFRPNQPPTFLPGGDLSKFSIPEDTPIASVIYR